jgi:hypothetical protein
VAELLLPWRRGLSSEAAGLAEIGYEPLRRASARSSAPSLSLRTASASPCPGSRERADAGPDDCAGLRKGRSRGAGFCVVSPAGASTMVASTFKIGMPIKRARRQPSTRTPSERCFRGSGTAVKGWAVALDLGIGHVSPVSS